MKKLWMTIDVYIDYELSVGTDQKRATLIGFSGQAYGDYFRGVVMPCAVDAQMTENNRTRLSAKYILEGVDCEGKQCKIYICNEGVMEAMQAQIITDSQALSPFNDKVFVSNIEASEKGVIVKLYDLGGA